MHYGNIKIVKKDGGKMDDFREIMELIYEFNKKYPEIRFGQLVHNLVTKQETLFYLPDSELRKRLELFLTEED